MLPDETDTSLPTTSAIPHNREAEEATIGAILINPDVIPFIARIITPHDFYIHRHQWICEAVFHLWEKKEPIDFLTISDELQKRGHLDDIGGPAYLTALLNQVPTSLHAEAYAKKVKDCSIRRNALTAANTIATLAYNEAAEIEEVMATSTKAVQNAFTGAVQDRAENIGDIVSRVSGLVHERAENETAPGIPTGFLDLDKNLGGGLQNTDFLILAGRPGKGKSSLLDQIAYNAVRTGHKWVYEWTGEMSNDQKGIRLLSTLAEIDSHSLRSGKLSDEEWPKLTHAVDMLSGLHLLVDETAILTIPVLRAKALALKAQDKLDLIILDYAGLMSAPGKNALEQSTYLSKGLKMLARELNIPVLAAQQLNRSVESRSDPRPVLSDLRDSGSWEQDADVVMFIWQPEDELTVTNLEIAKQRNGPTGLCKLNFTGKYTKFTAATFTHQEPPPGGYDYQQ
jgi:replicative DNA helicase